MGAFGSPSKTSISVVRLAKHRQFLSIDEGAAVVMFGGQWEELGGFGTVSSHRAVWTNPGTNRQTMLFTGSFERSLDDKGRVLLPKRMRKSLGECEAIFLTPGTDGCLELHTSLSLENLAQRATASAPNTKTIQSFSRLFYAQAEQLELDSQGRIRIPARLSEWAELEKNIVIVGVGFNWEIWNPSRWQTFYESQIAQFDLVHQSTFDRVPESNANFSTTQSTEAIESKEIVPKPR